MQKKKFACGGPPTGSRLKRRAASGGPLRGGSRREKKRISYIRAKEQIFLLFVFAISLTIYFPFLFFFAFNMYLFSFSFFFRARSLCICFLLFFLHTHSLYTCALTRYLCECGFSERYHSCVFHFFSFLFFPCRCSLLFVVRYRSLLYVVLFYFVQFFLYGLLVCVICVVYMFCLHLCVCVCGLVFV